NARRARELTKLRVVTDQIGAPTSAAIIADAVAHILVLLNQKKCDER
ncbi:MAG: sugar nucleotide-binding protein, partial [Pseudolabrys sp.]